VVDFHTATSTVMAKSISKIWQPIAKVYGSSLGDDRYEFYADINPDFNVDIRDLALYAKYYGRQY
jgi:hypothetical protein